MTGDRGAGDRAAGGPHSAGAGHGGRTPDGDGRPRRPHGHHHGDGGHTVAATTDRRILGGVLALIVAFMVGEVTVAILAHSLALWADAGHMSADALAVGGSLAAARLAARPAGGAWTYGLKRAEILSAAANGVLLLVVAVLVAVEAVRRLVHPQPTVGGALVAVAAVGVAVNVAATWLLGRANRRSLNVESVFQHILTDLYAFGGTIVAGIVIVATGFTRADALASLVVVGLMGAASWRLLRASSRVLLEAAPDSMDLDEIRAHLLETPHVTDVHDLHAWALTSDLPALSAHVVVADCCFAEGHAPQVLDQLQACLAGHFDVEHSTFQLEPRGHTRHERGQHA